MIKGISRTQSVVLNLVAALPNHQIGMVDTDGDSVKSLFTRSWRMSTTWKSSEDAVRDLILVVGETNEEELKAGLTKVMRSRPEKTPHRFVDPRTGDEIDVRNDCRPQEFANRDKSVGIGRGKLIEEFKHSSKAKGLQKQLRMTRPIGFGNNIIESYFAKGLDKQEPVPVTSNESISAEKKTWLKGKRRNVLLSTLLDKMQSNGDEVSCEIDSKSGDGGRTG